MIAAARADQLIHVGVAALDTAVHDADRLAPQDRLAAVTGLTGRMGVSRPPQARCAATGHGDRWDAVRRQRPDGEPGLLPAAGSEAPGLLT